jgi:hypothetical protein
LCTTDVACGGGHGHIDRQSQRDESRLEKEHVC